MSRTENGQAGMNFYKIHRQEMTRCLSRVQAVRSCVGPCENVDSVDAARLPAPPPSRAPPVPSHPQPLPQPATCNLKLLGGDEWGFGLLSKKSQVITLLISHLRLSLAQVQSDSEEQRDGYQFADSCGPGRASDVCCFRKRTRLV